MKKMKKKVNEKHTAMMSPRGRREGA